MSSLEKLINNNRDSFDKHIPDQRIWNHIQGELSNKKPPSIWKNSFIGIAASVLILISISFLVSEISDNNNIFYTIELTSPEGETHKLEQVIENNELTLVQFWSSWSKVCSDYNCYYFVPAYNKFNSLGFEVYAISVDENKQEWIKKIKEDELPWINVSDLKGFDSPICKSCDVKTIPYNFLINKKGEVVAKNLNAEALDQTLTTLLAQNK